MQVVRGWQVGLILVVQGGVQVADCKSDAGCGLWCVDWHTPPSAPADLAKMQYQEMHWHAVAHILGVAPAVCHSFPSPLLG
jgi:hypothetical protein